VPLVVLLPHRLFTRPVPVLSYRAYDKIDTRRFDMKRMTLTLAALVFILAGPLSLYASGQEQQAAAAKSPHEKEQYEKSMKERLGKLGKELDDLKALAASKSEHAEGKMKEYLADAEKKRKAAARKLDKLGKASKDTWDKFAADMEKSAKDFERAFNRAKTRKE